MDVTMWRRLADGEHPYDGGPFAADHIKVFRDDAREVLERLAALEAVAAAARPVAGYHPLSRAAQPADPGACRPRRRAREGRPVTANDRAAAVEIAAEVFEPYELDNVENAEAVVAALDAAGLLRRPDEAAYVAALELAARVAHSFVDRTAAHRDLRGVRAAMVNALDAVRATPPMPAEDGFR